MKLQIEDYYGNDLLILNFSMLSPNINDERFVKIGKIAMEHNYSLADCDADGKEYVRIQQIVDSQDEKAQRDLIELVAHLTSDFIWL